MFGLVRKVFSSVGFKVKKVMAIFAVGTGVLLGSSASATDVTLPTVGFEVTDYISAAITTLGGAVAVAVGGYVAYLVIRKAIRWCAKIG